MDRSSLAARLSAVAHAVAEGFVGPFTLGYLFVVPLAVTRLTPVTAEYLRTPEGMATIVLGPPLAVHCLVLYGWFVADFLAGADGRATDLAADFEE